MALVNWVPHSGGFKSQQYQQLLTGPHLKILFAWPQPNKVGPTKKEEEEEEKKKKLPKHVG